MENAVEELSEGYTEDIMSKAFCLLFSWIYASQRTGHLQLSRPKVCNRTGRTKSSNG
jgi:hypothetical protein